MKQIEIARMSALQVKLTQSLINGQRRIIYLTIFSTWQADTTIDIGSGCPTTIWTWIPKRTTVSVEPWPSWTTYIMWSIPCTFAKLDNSLWHVINSIHICRNRQQLITCDQFHTHLPSWTTTYDMWSIPSTFAKLDNSVWHVVNCIHICQVGQQLIPYFKKWLELFQIVYPNQYFDHNSPCMNAKSGCHHGIVSCFNRCRCTQYIAIIKAFITGNAIVVCVTDRV